MEPRNTRDSTEWVFVHRCDDDYRVLVASNRLDEAGDAAFLLKRITARQLQLPRNRYYCDNKTHLAWHREKKFAF